MLAVATAYDDEPNSDVWVAQIVDAGQDPRKSTGEIDGWIAERKVCGLNYSHFD